MQQPGRVCDPGVVTTPGQVCRHDALNFRRRQKMWSQVQQLEASPCSIIAMPQVNKSSTHLYIASTATSAL